MANNRKVSVLSEVDLIKAADLYYFNDSGTSKSVPQSVVRTYIEDVGKVHITQVAISSAEIKTLNSIGKILLASSSSTVPVLVLVTYTYGSVSYTSGQNIYVGYGGVQISEERDFENGYSDVFMFPSNQGNYDVSAETRLRCKTSDPATGDGTMVATILYRDR